MPHLLLPSSLVVFVMYVTPFTTITTVYLPTLLSLPTSRTITYPNPDSDDAPLFLICFCLVIAVEYTSAGARLLFFSLAIWDTARCGAVLGYHYTIHLYRCKFSVSSSKSPSKRSLRLHRTRELVVRRNSRGKDKLRKEFEQPNQNQSFMDHGRGQWTCLQVLL